MTTFFRAWVNQDAQIITLCSSPKPLVHNTYDGPCAFAVDGEIDGEFMDALSIMEQLRVKGQALSGLPIIRQTILPGVAAEVAHIDAVRQAMALTRRQVFVGMAAAGLITSAEAVAAANMGVPPALVEIVFSAMPLAQQTSARITFGAFQTAYREDPMTEILRQTGGLSAEQMDTFFATYAAI